MKLIENEWLFLNDIIFKMNSVDDISVLQQTFLESIRLLIPYDESTFYLYDGCSLQSPVAINGEDYIISKYLDTYNDIDYISWVLNSSKSSVLRETDLMPDDVREATAYYKEFYLPSNLHYCIVLTPVHNGITLGLVSLFRVRDGDDFSEKEAFILDILKEHLALRLFRLSCNTKKSEGASMESLEFVNEITKQFGLTQREIEILQLLERGMTNSDISKNLYITLPTLKRHISNIYKKSGVKNRLQLFKKLSHQ